MSVAGIIWCFTFRNISRIALLTRFRATALPIFFDAIIPSLFLFKLFRSEEIVHSFPTRFLFPSARTFSNSSLVVSLSYLLNDKSAIFQADRTFLPFRLRLSKIRLPPTVALRFRNPCTRFLLILLGWNVLFMNLSFLKYEKPASPHQIRWLVILHYEGNAGR